MSSLLKCKHLLFTVVKILLFERHKQRLPSSNDPNNSTRLVLQSSLWGNDALIRHTHRAMGGGLWSGARATLSSYTTRTAACIADDSPWAGHMESSPPPPNPPNPYHLALPRPRDHEQSWKNWIQLVR